MQVQNKFVSLHHNNKQIEIMRTAKDLKVGDKVKKYGFNFEVSKIEKDTYKNGTPCLVISLKQQGTEIADTFLNLKLDTKI